MSDINLLAVGAATVAAFIVSTVWYIVFGEALARARTPADDAAATPAWKMLAELIRSLVLALALAYFVVEVDVDDWGSSLTLAAVVWVGFPAVLLSGSVVWENVPWRAAAIHAGDWLVKLVIMTLILGLWR